MDWIVILCVIASGILFVMVGIIFFLLTVIFKSLRRNRKYSLVVLIVGAVILISASGIYLYMVKVVREIQRIHSEEIHTGMTMAEVKNLLGEPSAVATTDNSGNLVAPWGRRDRDLDIDGVSRAWGYQPYGGFNVYRVYFDKEGRVLGKWGD